jgi:phosphatidylserine/phosphatidylglycerophosphate/cardiolipin synthase-like enzyme
MTALQTRFPSSLRTAVLIGMLCWAGAMPARAFQVPAESATATDIQIFFTPGDDAAGNIIKAIDNARQQVLVQAFSFTHAGIAKALVAAHRRGVEVRLIANLDQTRKIRNSQIAAIAGAGVSVALDGEHTGAHNKVMVIDAGSANIADTVVITGSYNFTNAAQYRNAENVLLIRGNRHLAQAYQRNWQRHQQHAKPFDAARLNTR